MQARWRGTAALARPWPHGLGTLRWTHRATQPPATVGPVWWQLGDKATQATSRRGGVCALLYVCVFWTFAPSFGLVWLAVEPHAHRVPFSMTELEWDMGQCALLMHSSRVSCFGASASTSGNSVCRVFAHARRVRHVGISRVAICLVVTPLLPASPFLCTAAKPRRQPLQAPRQPIQPPRRLSTPRLYCLQSPLWPHPPSRSSQPLTGTSSC